MCAEGVELAAAILSEPKDSAVKTRSNRLLCVVAGVAGAISPALGQVVKSYTYANKTGTDANDFHIRFDTNANPPTPPPMATSHSNSIQNAAGAGLGTFPRPAASGSNPGGGLNNNVLDYTGPTVSVANGQQLRITVPFPGRNAGRPTDAYFTLNGNRIVGRVDRIALNESFSSDSTGVCSLDLAPDPDSAVASAMLSNVQVWTGLTSDQMFDYANLSPGSAMSLGSVSVSAASPAHFSLGSLSADSFAVVTYDLSYFDSDLGSSRTATGMAYGSAVPAPGPLALSSVGLLLVGRRRRR